MATSDSVVPIVIATAAGAAIPSIMAALTARGNRKHEHQMREDERRHEQARRDAERAHNDRLQDEARLEQVRAASTAERAELDRLYERTSEVVSYHLAHQGSYVLGPDDLARLADLLTKLGAVAGPAVQSWAESMLAFQHDIMSSDLASFAAARRADAALDQSVPPDETSPGS